MIRLDMDGVVADWLLAALRLHGALAYLPVWKRNEWGVAEQIGLTEEEFWRPMHDPRFWEEDIRPYPYAREFVDALRELDRVEIHTVLAKSPPSCGDAKRSWCQYHLGLPANSVTVHTGMESKFDGNFRVLVDDHPRIRQVAQAYKAPVVLVERPWNSLDPRLRFDTVDYQKVYDDVKRYC